MLLRKTHELLVEYNKEVQKLNSNPSAFDYDEKLKKARDRFNEKLITLVDQERHILKQTD